MAIMGGNSSSDQGSGLLGQITVSPDFPKPNGKLTCDDNDTMAELRDYNADNPTIVLCDPGALGHGGIAKSYGTIPAVTCANFDSRISWKMETLGSVLLHEYTHWLKLVAPPLSKETDDVDDGYGPADVRALDKTLATNNADSYSWFATENMWTAICHTQYGDPTDTDGDDPNCGGSVCQEPESP